MWSSRIPGYIAEWSVLILCALLPFFFIPVAWASIASAKMLLAILITVVAALAWTVGSFNDGTLRVPKSFLLAACALIPVAYIISALATGASRASFIGSVGQDTVVAVAIWYVLLFVCANVLAVDAQKITTGLRAFLAGGAVLALVQFLHIAFPELTFGGVLVGAAVSAVGSWHDLGILSALMLFFSLALISSSVAGNRFWRFLLTGIALASFAVLLVVNLGDVWLGLGGLGLFFAAYLWDSSRAEGAPASLQPPRPALWWVAFGVIAILMYWAGPFVHGVLPQPLRVAQFEVRPSWQGTFTIGQQVFTEPRSLFFGSGPNTFTREWSLYKPLAVNGTEFWNTDFYFGVGFIPTSVVTVGIVGLIAWIAVIIALLFSVARAFRMRGVRTGSGVVRGTLAAGALFLTIFHILYIPGPALSALTFILFGLLIAAELSSGVVRDFSAKLSFGAWKGRIFSVSLCVFAVAVLFTGIQSVRALVSDVLVNRAVAAYSTGGDIAGASRAIAGAIAVDSRNDRARLAAVEVGLLQLAELVAANDTSDAARNLLQSTLTKTIEHGLAAVSIESRNYQNWLVLARLYGELAGVGVEGAEANARTAYQQAAADNPTSPLPLLGLAQLDLIGENDAAAREHLEAALALKSDLAAAHFLLSQIHARANDLPKAHAAAAAAAELVPEDPLGWYNLGTILYAEADYQNAALALERAAGIQNDYANALFLLGLSYSKLDRNPDALATLKAVAVLSPADEALIAIIANITAGRDPFAGLPISR
jgi:tetratricopeptide (TPR) repeat protein